MIRGRGAYNFAGLGESVGTSLGGTLGRYAGTALGSLIGGSGAYDIKSNTIATDASQVPSMHSFNETIRVSHREYIGEIKSSVNAGEFQVETWHLNPGLDRSFPWLAAIANSFQEYSLLGFAAQFKSSSGDALSSTNTALGSVIMNADYNISKPQPEGKADMLNAMWCVQGKPSENVLLPIECDPSQNPFHIMYVRGGDVPAGRDPKMYDLCNINVAAMGCQGTETVLGELWFTYDIELRKPSTDTLMGEALNSAEYSKLAQPITIGDFFDTMTKTVDNVGLTLGHSDIIFPTNAIGVYMVTVHVVSTGSPFSWASMTWTPGMCVVESFGFAAESANSQTKMAYAVVRLEGEGEKSLAIAGTIDAAISGNTRLIVAQLANTA